MEVFKQAAIQDVLDDFLIFRNLQPVDPRLPGLDALRSDLGLGGGRTPRKIEADYGRVVAEILIQAQQMVHPGLEIKRLVYIGDTLGSDRQAFQNICQARDWPGMVVITNEKSSPAPLRVSREKKHPEIFSTQWQDLLMLEELCRTLEFPIDSQTVLVLDLDKTLVGARGRNDQVINQARIAAVRKTVASYLGEDFSQEEFEKHYQEINQDKYHFLTRDNQDFVAYICLLLGTSYCSLEELLQKIQASQLEEFADFVGWIEQGRERLSPALEDFHQRFLLAYQKGDPTPFKDFRRQEYLETLSRMGNMLDQVAVKELLKNEIVITAEVFFTAQRWKGKGALLFGLSDKPDEASLPTREQEGKGLLAIHQAPTHVVGWRS